MKLAILFSFVLLCSFVPSNQSVLSDLIADLISILVLYLEMPIKKMDTVQLTSAHKFTFGDLNLPALIGGTLEFDNISVYGLENFLLRKDFINCTIDQDEYKTYVISLSMKLFIPDKIGVGPFKYRSDFGLNQTIPIYGKGQFLLEVRNVDIDFKIGIRLSNPIQLSSLRIRPQFETGQTGVTGVFNNPEVSSLITTVLTTVQEIITFLWHLDLDWTSCVLSDLIKEIINDYLNPNPDISTLKLPSNSNCGTYKRFYGLGLEENNSANIMQIISKHDVGSYMDAIQEFLETYLLFG